MLPTITLKLEDGSFTVQARYEVCGTCEGTGTVLHEAFRGVAITMDEWYGPDWDEESRHAYRTGGYDVQCYECKGLRVVPVPDYLNLSQDDAHDVAAAEEEAEREAEFERQWAAESRMERMMGC